MFINSIELYGFVGIRDVFFFYNEAVKRSHCKKTSINVVKQKKY